MESESSIIFNFWYCVFSYPSNLLTSGFTHLFLQHVVLKYIGSGIPSSDVSRNQRSGSSMTTKMISASERQNFLKSSFSLSLHYSLSLNSPHLWSNFSIPNMERLKDKGGLVQKCHRKPQRGECYADIFSHLHEAICILVQC